jgi:hypothetical protein
MTVWVPFAAPEASPVCPSAAEPYRNVAIRKYRVLFILLRISGYASRGTHLLSPFSGLSCVAVCRNSPLPAHLVMLDPNSPASDCVRAADCILGHAKQAIELEDVEVRVAALEQAAELFCAHEFRPASVIFNGGAVVRLRMPTQREQQGDFSQSRDQNGNLLTSLTDNTTGQSFPGLKIPASRQYAPGVAVLNRYPAANFTQVPGTNYNYR